MAKNDSTTRRVGSNLENVTCKYCARVLAIITPDGLVPADHEIQACNACHEFRVLHEALRIADGKFELLKEKRKDHVGRESARDAAMKARVKFENLVMRVECQTDRIKEGKEGKSGEEMKGLVGEEGQPSGLKRSRSKDSPPGRKRLKFSDSLVDRDDHRDYLEFNRRDENYVPGRYAPPDGTEYLDTSGYTQTFLKFSRMKRIGAKWTEIEEENEEKDESSGPRKKRKFSGEIEDSNEDRTKENTGANPSARALRLTRRLDAQQTSKKQTHEENEPSRNASNAAQENDAREQLMAGAASLSGEAMANKSKTSEVADGQYQPIAGNDSGGPDGVSNKSGPIQTHHATNIRDPSTEQRDNAGEESMHGDMQRSDTVWEVAFLHSTSKKTGCAQREEPEPMQVSGVHGAEGVARTSDPLDFAGDSHEQQIENVHTEIRSEPGTSHRPLQCQAR